jgi:lantibiotic modifying enzyme
VNPEPGQWRVESLGPDLYDGLAGIALFLAYLGDTLGENRHTELARVALDGVRRRLQDLPPVAVPVGVFNGWGGMIYTLTHLGALWADSTLLAEAGTAAALLLPLIDRDEDLDVVAGSAGCLLGLLALHHCAPSPRVLELAVRCGDRLLATAQPQEQGLRGVRTPALRALTGLAHGAAGIGWRWRSWLQ